MSWPPLFPCFESNCGGLAALACDFCEKHFCTAHSGPSTHFCPDVTKDAAAEFDRLTSRLDIDALKTRCSLLNRGAEVKSVKSFSLDDQSSYGGVNVHVTISFSNGHSWIVRIQRQSCRSPPALVQEEVILQQVGTMKFLKKIGVPVPQVHDYVAAELPKTGNPVGVPYIAMEMLPGAPLDWGKASPSQKHHLLQQFADISRLIEDNPFSQVGSLSPISPPSSESVRVGKLIHPGYLADPEPSNDLKNVFPGPFNTATALRVAGAQNCMASIEAGNRYPDHPVDAWIVQNYLRQIASESDFDPTAETGKFYLRHAEDKGDHILVDENFNIKGIIDWDWSFTTSHFEAFATPLFLFDVAAFYNGSNELGKDEKLYLSILESKDFSTLAKAVKNGKKVQRFDFCIGRNVESRDEELFLGLVKLCSSGGEVTPIATWNDWKVATLKDLEKDKVLQALIKKEQNLILE